MTANNLVPVIDAKAAAVARLAMKDEGNPLGNVLIVDGWAIGADGIWLMKVELPPWQPAPNLAWCPGASPEIPPGPILVPAGWLRRVTKRLGWGLSVWFTRAADGELAAAVRDWRHGLTISPQMTDEPTAPFPDTEKVWPTGAPQASIVLDARRLAVLLKAVVRAGACERLDAVTLHVYGPTDGVVLAAQDGDGRRIRAMLMPMVPDSLLVPFPDQERGEPPAAEG